MQNGKFNKKKNYLKSTFPIYLSRLIKGSLPMALVKQALKEIVAYKSMENDLQWMAHSRCATHGSSGIFIISENNVDGFCKNYFSYLNDDTRKVLTAALKSLFYTEGFAWTRDYIDIDCGSSTVDKPITGEFYFMYIRWWTYWWKAYSFYRISSTYKKTLLSFNYSKR